MDRLELPHIIGPDFLAPHYGALFQAVGNLRIGMKQRDDRVEILDVDGLIERGQQGLGRGVHVSHVALGVHAGDQVAFQSESVPHAGIRPDASVDGAEDDLLGQDRHAVVVQRLDMDRRELGPQQRCFVEDVGAQGVLADQTAVVDVTGPVHPGREHGEEAVEVPAVEGAIELQNTGFRRGHGVGLGSSSRTTSMRETWPSRSV